MESDLRYRSFFVKFIGPTNFKGSRISIRDTWNGERVVIPSDYSGDTNEQAIRYVESCGISVDAVTSDNNKFRNVILSLDFKTSLKKGKK